MIVDPKHRNARSVWASVVGTLVQGGMSANRQSSSDTKTFNADGMEVQVSDLPDIEVLQRVEGVQLADMPDTSGLSGPGFHSGRISGSVWNTLDGDKDLIGEFRRLNPGVDVDQVRADRSYRIPTRVDDVGAARENFQAVARGWQQKAEAQAQLVASNNASETQRLLNRSAADSGFIQRSDRITSTIDNMPSTLGYQIVANVNERGVPVSYGAYNKFTGNTDYLIGPTGLGRFMRNSSELFDSAYAETVYNNAPQYQKDALRAVNAGLNGDVVGFLSADASSFKNAVQDREWVSMTVLPAVGGAWASLPGRSVAGASYDAAPWLREVSNFKQGGTFLQCLEGSCVSATAQNLSNGAITEAQMVAQIGEWSNAEALAHALNLRKVNGGGWIGGMVSEEHTVALANSGRIGAELQVPRQAAHMVSIEPIANAAGKFNVLDTGVGASYTVDTSWIVKYVSKVVAQPGK
jgi:hypothetical protein